MTYSFFIYFWKGGVGVDWLVGVLVGFFVVVVEGLFWLYGVLFWLA